MSAVTTNQPLGTPTWIDLGIPDLDRAMTFYGSVFGWEFDVGPEEYGRYTMCLLGGNKVAALMPNPDENATEFWWNVYLATDDLDATVARSAAAGGTLLMEPKDIADQGRMAMVRDPSGAQFGLWQGRAHVGCELVNEPNTLLRNDLVTPESRPGAGLLRGGVRLHPGRERRPARRGLHLSAQTGRARDRWHRGRPGRLRVLLGHALSGRRYRRGRRRRAGERGYRGRSDGHAVRADRGCRRSVRCDVHGGFPAAGWAGVEGSGPETSGVSRI